MKNIILLVFMASCTAFAQITITSSDLANQFSFGNTITIHEDTSKSTIDIGSPGGGNNWDFSALVGDLSLDLTIVDPSATPYNSYFPDAVVASHTVGIFNEVQGEIWQYSKVDTNFDNFGTALIINSNPGNVTTIDYSPAKHEMKFPLTYNSNWTPICAQTLGINGTPFLSYNLSTIVTVDAYGTMTLPGGANYDALRMRMEATINGITSLTFTFLTKSGAQVSVNASDANQPSNGVINTESTSYNAPLATSLVEHLGTLPMNFNLRQNYPNPFNPSTKIEYSIPEVTFVQLKVYDILGNEVATLINEEQSAGTYRADFIGNDLTSGIYFYTLNADQFTETKKMIFLK
jgi:hypothetical protein